MNAVRKGLQKRIYVSAYAILFLVMLLGLSILLESCSDSCEVRTEYTYYEPVYTTLETIREGFAVEGPRPMQAVGKIYFKDQFLFVNEPGEGIHVIDDNDPSSPENKKFLKIPGNYELAIKGNVLYADSYIDLVVIDISDIDNPKEIERLEGIFSRYNSLGFYVDDVRGVVTEWQENKEVTVTKSDCDANLQPWGGIYYLEGVAIDAVASFDSKAAIAPGIGSGSGLGGSLARFTISQNHLYMLDGGDVQVVDVTAAAAPQPGTRHSVSWDIETIFPYKDKLFIGARSGMHILDISTPQTPATISTYQHVTSCDPVVVTDDYAYVTLRSGNPSCDGFDNQLEVIDIQNLQSPQLLEVYPMTNPHGLGIDGDVLFVCDGTAGLKVYNAADKHAIDKNLIARHRNIHAYDVIPFNDLLMLIGEDGIFQYDYSDPEHLSLLSHIDLENE